MHFIDYIQLHWFKGFSQQLLDLCNFCIIVFFCFLCHCNFALLWLELKCKTLQSETMSQKDTFSDHELTALADEIVSDSPYLLDTDHDTAIQSAFSNSSVSMQNEEYIRKNYPLLTSILSSDSSFIKSLPPVPPPSKPKLRIVHTNQLPANDSFNISLPPVPKRKTMKKSKSC